MKTQKYIQQVYAWMLQGRRFKLKEIDAFRDMIWKESQDGRIEAMMLFFAEAMHDVYGFGQKRSARILRYCDEKMKELIDKTNDNSWDMDDLRLRVWEKTHFMFAMTEEDQQHIVAMLQAAGYNVTAGEKE